MDNEARGLSLREFAAKSGLSFQNWTLLDRALTHASITNDEPDNRNHYETLEFLGDAALELAVSETLLARLPEGTPGEYTQWRARIVDKASLAEIARQLNIGPLIRLGRGEESAGGREREGLLADCVESIIAAVYLDAGWEATRAFVGRCFSEHIDAVITSARRLDYRSQLQNYCQQNKIALPEFAVVAEEGPAHDMEFEVEVRLRGKSGGRGRGRSKKEAEQAAAREALIQEGVESTD
ncbi:MAG: ribonuclease III [Candidatus Hydrogenedentota bacterium]